MKISRFMLASRFLLVVGSAIMISSCSSSHNASEQSRNATAYEDGQPEYYSTTPAIDQYIQMKSQDEARWSYFDDCNYYDSYYSPMMAGAYYGGGTGMSTFNPYGYWNSFYTWNSYYNPYFYNPFYGGGIILANPKYYSFGTTAYSGLPAFSPVMYTTPWSGGNRFYTPANTRYQTNAGHYYTPSTRSNNHPFSSPGNSGNSNVQHPSQPVRNFSPSAGGNGSTGRPGRN